MCVIACICTAIALQVVALGAAAQPKESNHPGNASERAGETSKISEGSLRELVIRSLDANDEKIGGVRTSLSSVSEDPTIKKTETIVLKTPNGGRESTVRSPRYEYRYSVTFEKEKLNIIRYDQQNHPLAPLYFDGHKWIEFNSRQKHITIRRPDQVAAGPPCDPREVAMDDVRLALRSFIRMSTVKQVAVPTGRPSDKKDMFEAEWIDGVGQKLTLDFDPAVNLLPVKSVRYRSDGSIFSKTEIAYQQIPKRGGYLLDRAVVEFYPEGTRAFNIGWRQRSTITLLEMELLTKDQSNEATSYKVPAGFHVRDLTSRAPVSKPSAQTPPRVNLRLNRVRHY